MALFDQEIKDQLKSILSSLNNTIKILFFTQEIECPSCSMTHEFLSEIVELSDKMHLSTYEFKKDKEIADKFKIDKIPAIIVTDEKETIQGVRFFGMPAGYEINSFLSACLEVSGHKENIDSKILEEIKKIDKEIHIQVFITLSCPYCPSAVATAHKLAIENKNIISDMVESSTFTPMAIKYNVSSVPKIVINEKNEFIGAQPIEKFLEVIKNI